MTPQAQLTLAIEAATRGGAVLREAMTKPNDILSDAGKDIKLQADQDAEAVIIQALASSGFPVLAEESGSHGDTETDGPLWVIDPLDGTMNFSRGIPLCCLSIGLMHGNQPILGVIYDFNHEDWYTGIVGEGAWLNDSPMHVSAITQREKAILSTGFPTNRDYSDEAIAEIITHVQEFKKVRCFGTAALALAYVASGCIEAYAEDAIMLWDVAAGVALVKAAGGQVELSNHETIPWARHVRAAAHQSLWSTP